MRYLPLGNPPGDCLCHYQAGPRYQKCWYQRRSHRWLQVWQVSPLSPEPQDCSVRLDCSSPSCCWTRWPALPASVCWRPSWSRAWLSPWRRSRSWCRRTPWYSWGCRRSRGLSTARTRHLYSAVNKQITNSVKDFHKYGVIETWNIQGQVVKY